AFLVPVEGELVLVAMVDHEVPAEEREVRFLPRSELPVSQKSPEAGKHFRAEFGLRCRNGGIDNDAVRHAHSAGHVAPAVLPNLHQLTRQAWIGFAEERSEDAGKG